jgi:hypothetical protein
VNTLTDVDRGWVSGVLEGEGTFHVRDDKYIRIAVEMTDHDVIARLHEVTGIGRVYGPYPRREQHWKPISKWMVQRNAEVRELLWAVYPQMGRRRRARIRELLDAVPVRAQESIPWDGTHCRNGHARTESRAADGGCRQCRRDRNREYKARQSTGGGAPV